MDFFSRQDSARRQTGWLLAYFALAVLGVIAAVYGAVALLFSRHDPWNPALFVCVSAGTLAMIVLASAFKILQLSGGGSTVAEMFGGRLINANTADASERKLLNVVEEMAIASGTPVPQIYVMDREAGINAFAAGHSTNDMAICVTRGALKNLTRDELQGVVGHEFSHILNGDMRLNLRLMGLVFGILCLAVFGRVLLDTRSRGRGRDRNPLPLLGLALLIIGGVGVFFAKLIKSAISRQREFLADASAVQFTRNPAGLANALKKIGTCGSEMDAPNAEDASHFFFANGVSGWLDGLFSTHPPLEQRILALDPGFDGTFLPAAPVEDDYLPRLVPLAAAPLVPAAGLPKTRSTAALAAGTAIPAGRALPHIGAPTAVHLDYAADLRSKLPAELTGAARDPMSAVALIYALLLGTDPGLRARQLAELQKQIEPAIHREVAKLAPVTATLESRARLPLASLCVNALRQLSPAQYRQFKAALQELIESDGQIELFEYALQKIVLRQLDPFFGPYPKQVVQFYVLTPLLPDCSVLLSALAHAGQDNPVAAGKAFRLGLETLRVADLPLLPIEDSGLEKIDVALNHLNLAAPQLKKQFLAACAAAIAADGFIQEEEAELLRAIADTLGCPIPPLLHI